MLNTIIDKVINPTLIAWNTITRVFHCKSISKDSLPVNGDQARRL